MDIGIFGFKGWNDLICPDGQIIIAPTLNCQRNWLASGGSFRRRRGLRRGGRWLSYYCRFSGSRRLSSCTSTTSGQDQRESNQQADNRKCLAHFLLLSN